MEPPSFAYLFERFPSFNQTFCSREVEEMARQRMDPLVIAIRHVPEQTANTFPAALAEKIHYLPSQADLESQTKTLRERHKLPFGMARHLDRPDKLRLCEAAHLGPFLKERGIRHVHAHFAGIAARTAFWLREYYGIGFSFTGHANDIFRETDFAVSLEKMVEAARFVVTPSDFSREWLAAKFPKQAPKIFAVYNGIRVEEFKPARREFHSGDPLKILSVGRYVEKKGFSYLIEACRILKERQIPFHCEIAGEGPLEEELAARIGRHDLGAMVVLTGPRPQADLIPMYAGADLFVLPCVRETGGGMDNLPTVIMEAMAAGLPVVSTPVAGVPEMIVDGETGWIVPEKDPVALADAIARAAQAPDLARQCAERGQTRATALFSAEVTVRRLKHLLVRLADVHPGPRAVEQDPALKPERGGT